MRTILRLTTALPILFISILCQTASGEVTDSTASGFTVKITVRIQAPPDIVYGKVTHDVARWWNPSHTFSGDAGNLSIDAAAGGCFCEKLTNGGGVRHMTVVFADPGKTLRLEGAIGPLQSMGVTGAMTWKFTQSGDGTTLELTYCVGGYTPNGLQRISRAADFMLSEQVGRLKSFIETGAPGAPGTK